MWDMYIVCGVFEDLAYTLQNRNIRRRELNLHHQYGTWDLEPKNTSGFVTEKDGLDVRSYQICCLYMDVYE